MLSAPLNFRVSPPWNIKFLQSLAKCKFYTAEYFFSFPFPYFPALIQHILKDFVAAEFLRSFERVFGISCSQNFSHLLK